MSIEYSFMEAGGRGLRLHVVLAPRSSTNRIVGIHGERLKLAVTAPPVDNKANQQLVSFLAKFFGCSKRSVHILSGQSARQKTILLEGVNADKARAALDEALSSA